MPGRFRSGLVSACEKLSQTTPRTASQCNSKTSILWTNRLIGSKEYNDQCHNPTFKIKFMPHLEWIWERRNRTPVLMASAVIVLAIAGVDWWTKPYFSLGFLYLFPIMLAAGFLPRWATVSLGVACALLSERFSNLDPADAHIRLGFEALALCGCGLLTAEVLRNRRLSLEAQERIRVLVETSPAAIVTVDEHGFIELANRAAVETMAPHDGRLIGQPIAAFLPELHHALRWEEGPQFRTSMQCRGHRGNGESFLAEVWFSTYKEGTTAEGGGHHRRCKRGAECYGWVGRRVISAKGAPHPQ